MKELGLRNEIPRFTRDCIPGLLSYKQPGYSMKIVLVLITFILFLTSCRPDDKLDELRKLEMQRDVLQEQIDELRADIAAETGQVLNGNLAHVIIQQVTPAMFRHYITIQGTVKSDNNILIPAQSSGVVKKIRVREGQTVRKGQLLAELDAAILKNTLAELEINLKMARTVFERQKRLWDKKIGSEVQFLQAKTNNEALEKRFAATEEQYRLTKIVAPISGSVDEILIKEGEAIGAGFGAIRVVQLSELKITGHLSEEYTGNIHSGDSVKVRFPVLNRELFSTIRSVSQVIDPQNRTFPVEIDLPADAAEIQPNMLAVLTINDYQNPDAFVIPINIVQSTGNSRFVFTAQGQDSVWTVERRTVKGGKYYGDFVEIIDGITSGEYVVDGEIRN
jgi:RND family efflux transporter MFP subunit